MDGMDEITRSGRIVSDFVCIPSAAISDEIDGRERQETGKNEGVGNFVHSVVIGDSFPALTGTPSLGSTDKMDEIADCGLAGPNGEPQ